MQLNRALTWTLCEPVCQNWHITKPTDTFDFNAKGLNKLVKHFRKYEGTLILSLSDNVFRKDFTRMMHIYDRVKQVGMNVRIFYQAMSHSDNLKDFKSDFVNWGGENPMEIEKDSQFKFSYEGTTLIQAWLSIFSILYLI